MVYVVFFSFLAFTSFLFSALTFIQLTIWFSSQTTIYFKGREDDKVLWPLLWDACLLFLFVQQHSFMASDWWKKKMADLGLETVKRSIYCLGTVASLQILMRYWQVVKIAALWRLEPDLWPRLCTLLLILHVVLWIIIYLEQLTMDLPELLGLKQVYYYSLGLNSPMSYKSPAVQRLYKHMRHPGATCMLFIMWVHPVMTLTRLFVATTLSLYLYYGHRVTPHDVAYLSQQRIRKEQFLTRTSVSA